ncbi:glycerol-3-phosphate 1-O-acyltransferase PlsY [Mycoplasmopsis columbinasalis]|uniref:Glycerol-3-phosphate acyltransferase n=1 Tax=Mycoplasmopsis columbinasalis TaxID=114880 RepID=A0A449BAR5_9BACT|nr:glycerol-3-phosphate 1-O-acyltransferase PlsY [Mycoplasmopsis columbinasalis]VEU78292.1 G3P acyltransferase [Mycoplasmopsis columbinasalis]
MNQVTLAVFANLALFCLGYLLFGSLNTSIILSHKYRNDDIRNHFSKNAGATNSLRAYGKKFALTVFLIDSFKTSLPVIIFATLCNHVFPTYAHTYKLFPQLIGFGTVVGHCFPIYFKFKGGKGVACATGLLLSTNIVLFLIAAVTFFCIAFTKKMVSLASIMSAVSVLPFALFPWMVQGELGWWLNVKFYSPGFLPNEPWWFINGLVVLLAAILVIVMHHSNIKRLLQKKEKPLNLKEVGVKNNNQN